MPKSVYHRTDTGVDLYVTTHLPDPSIYPGPTYPYEGTLHPGGFKAGRAGPPEVSLSVAAKGAIGCDVEYRIAPPHTFMNTASGSPPSNHPVPGQDTVSDDGHFPKQHQDVAQFVVWARAQPDCNGEVWLVGGSAGGGHALMLAAIGRVDDDGLEHNGIATGAIGNTRPDKVIACSGVPDLVDFLYLICPPGSDETCPHEATMNYLGRTDNFPDFTNDDLAAAAVASATTYMHADMPPILMARSDDDGMGIKEAYDAAIAKMESLGFTQSYAAVPVTGKYRLDVIHVNAYAHAFMYWALSDSDPPQYSANIALPWLFADIETEDVEPPPPPENNLLYYEATLTTPSGSPTPGIIPVPILKDQTSIQISGIALATLQRFTLWGVNQFGAGIQAFADFTSNATLTSGDMKARAKGTYALLPSPGGAPADITGRPFLTMDHVDGARWRSAWINCEAVKGTYDFTDILAFLDILATNGKFGGVGIGAGIHYAPWLKTEPGATFFVEHGPDSGEMPLFWNATYLNFWKACIAAQGAALDGHPALSYVTIGGLGQVMETSVCADLPGAGGDFDALTAAAIADGFTDLGNGQLMTAWDFAARTIIAAYVQAFPTTPVLLTLARPVRTVSGDNQLAALCGWMTSTYGEEHMGFMNAGLTGVTVGGSGGTKINQTIESEAGTCLTGYQFARPSNDPRCDPSLVPYVALTGYINTLTAGINMGSEFIEVYLPDAESVDTDYVDATTTTQTALKAQ